MVEKVFINTYKFSMNTLPLWRRCRTLASHLRLDMLEWLAEHPSLCVKEIAADLGIAEEVASKNLQLLASAGFMTRMRIGKYLYHTVVTNDALLAGVLDEKATKEKLLDTVTALTHERRVLILKTLNCGLLTLEELCRQTGISKGAMRRQLEKLERRSFVKVKNGKYSMVTPDSLLGRRMVELALEDSTPAQVWICTEHITGKNEEYH